jgi:HAMP domain-containing protein
MKNETKRTLKAAALAVLAIAALLALGWLETQAGLPNH